MRSYVNVLFALGGALLSKAQARVTFLASHLGTLSLSGLPYSNQQSQIIDLGSAIEFATSAPSGISSTGATVLNGDLGTTGTRTSLSSPPVQSDKSQTLSHRSHFSTHNPDQNLTQKLQPRQDSLLESSMESNT